MKGGTKKFLLIIMPVFFFGALIFAYGAYAGTDDNVSGYAWSDTIGWISFNCTNEDTCFNCTNEDTCGSSNYGANVDSSTGGFSGYAWSEHIGWISFNRGDTSNPPSDDPGGGSGPIAVLNTSNNQVSGWARAVSVCEPPSGDGLPCSTTDSDGGWDGWIRLDDDGQGYEGVSLTSTSDTPELENWAWGGGIVMGWVSFNCSSDADCNPDDADHDVPVDINLPPSVTPDDVHFFRDSGISDGICGSNEIFEWTYSDPEDDPQSAFQIQVDTNSDFSSPEHDTGKTSSSGSSASMSVTTLSSELDFDETYHWRIRVWDSNDNVSDWAEFDEDNDGNPDTFTTPNHPYPEPTYDINPDNPSAEEEVEFIDNATCYSGSGNANITSGSCEGQAGIDYLWDFGDGNTTTTEGNVTHTYDSEGSFTTSLRITDNNLTNIGTQPNSCTFQQPVNVEPPVPDFREIAPVASLGGILNNAKAMLHFEESFGNFSLFSEDGDNDSFVDSFNTDSFLNKADYDIFATR